VRELFLAIYHNALTSIKFDGTITLESVPVRKPEPRNEGSLFFKETTGAFDGARTHVHELISCLKYSRPNILFI